MKIAIMTQPLGKNYGGMMQAYALQKVLRNLGHEVTTIDYNYAESSIFRKMARLPYRFLQKLTGKRKAPINLEAKLPYILEHTQQFIKQNISMSEYVDNDAALNKHFDSNSYDVVVVGSDQTWRPRYSPNIYNFYLDFLKHNKNIKKITYASSFGVDNWEYSSEQTDKCAELAALFDAISVREESGVELCEKHLNVKSECVLDPTLLLTKEDYIELLGSKFKGGKGEGVFTYVLDSSQAKMAVAENVSKQLNTHVFKCQAKCSLGSLASSSLQDYKMPAVQDWLASFANAEFIVTDSFHGMVFSIMFEKPFLVIANKKRGAARFESLLNKLQAEEHLIYDVNNIDYSILSNIKPVDKEKLNVLKSDSVNFIHKYLN
ncbi:polysaccharide pyruvyl transferase family protein [Pseudoalteromonas sp. AOP31-A2-14]|uniref:polysaccharide pyruvyl transferase family protein n=1 Tax=Pseudoalteromonas sp. AOP31-A2-14 TaxID=3457695 RepID=UPI004036FD07